MPFLGDEEMSRNELSGVIQTLRALRQFVYISAANTTVQTIPFLFILKTEPKNNAPNS